MNEPLLSLSGLRVAFPVGKATVDALRGVDLSISSGECLGLVGESGSGKSLTAFSTMGLLPPGGRVVAGEARFDGQDLLKLSERSLERLRGNEISMIFQEPMTALNPVMRVGDQISAPLKKHLRMPKRKAKARAIELLDLVGIPDPVARVENFPHEMSGGMRQRVMIAMALACEPRLLIADEPTTALDVTIQAQIIELLNRLRRELDLAILMITHDLGVIAEMATRVAVMYAGKVVEECPIEDLFNDPLHPYSSGLLNSTPDLEKPVARRLSTIDGAVPHISDLPMGCAFHPRCAEARDICRENFPREQKLQDQRRVTCWAREAS